MRKNGRQKAVLPALRVPACMMSSPGSILRTVSGIRMWARKLAWIFSPFAIPWMQFDWRKSTYSRDWSKVQAHNDQNDDIKMNKGTKDWRGWRWKELAQEKASMRSRTGTRLISHHHNYNMFSSALSFQASAPSIPARESKVQEKIWVSVIFK